MFTEIALGSFRPCRSFCWNLLPIDPGEDELARDPGPARSPHSSSISSVPSRNLTLGPTLVPALIPALAPALIPTDELFKQFMKTYLKLNQRPRQPLAERKQIFKAKVPEVYYGNLHMDCYHFSQQCKDYFETAGATGAN